jgi:cyclohexyl-isocyanide hydratase
MPLTIGMLLFPRLTQLDLTGPFEVLHRLPGAKVHLAWKTRDPVVSDSGLAIVPTTTLDECPALDVLFVPGGSGVTDLLDDAETLSFLRRQAAGARYVTSVCTGALLLGAAGLLAGYDATTHWAFHDLLPMVQARPVKARVVVDRNRITGGGVTSGIDFALRVASEIEGERFAQTVQLGIEYDPEPPFRSGGPDGADPEIVAAIRTRYAETHRARAARLQAAPIARSAIQVA